MVQSLDGIIAKPDNSVAWFETTDQYDKGVDFPQSSESLQKIDCYVMGYATYAHALELSKTYGWVYGDVPTIVVTHRDLPREKPSVEFYSGDLHKLVEEKLKPKYKNVWVVGGSMLINEVIREGLADEIRLNILPILLGEGKLFFEQLAKELPLHVKNVTAYKNGMVELHYEIRK